MKGRFLNFVIATLLYLSLFVASIATGAHFLIGHVTDLGASSSALVKDFGAKRETIVPLIIDQVLKNADAKEVKTINENRKQITRALKDLLVDPKFSGALAATIDPIGKALQAGQNSVQLDTTVLVKTLSEEVNKVAGKEVITPKDLKNISKPDPIDLKQPSKVYKTVKQIINSLLLFWVLVLLLLIALFIRKREAAYKIAGKFLLSLGLPILILWFLLPLLLVNIANSSSDSKLPATLLPIAFKEVTGFTMTMGIVFTVLGVILLVAARLTKRSKAGAHSMKEGSIVEGDLGPN